MIFVSTIPTGVIGYVGRDFVEAASGILLIPGICLVITAGLLFISDFAPDGTDKQRRRSQFGWNCRGQSSHQVTVEGSPIELSFKEFELLSYFIENQGIALSREKILNSVWNYDYFGDARTIDTHVKKLRSKLGEKGEYIKTVWGMGYKFEVEE